MNLESKIRAILDESKKADAKEDKFSKADDKNDELDDEGNEQYHAEPDADNKGGPSDNDEDNEADKKDEKDGDTDMSKDTKKEKAEVKEDNTVPGLGKSLVDHPDYTSGDSATAKIKAGLGRGNKGDAGKVAAKAVGDEGGESDAKATQDTAKIKAGLGRGNKGDAGKLKQEAIEAMFDGETLSEGFIVKAEAIFEATVGAIVEERLAQLQEEHQAQLDEAVEEVKGELVEQIDGYLDRVIQEWMNDNAFALESGVKVAQVSSFVEAMKEVFADHYINVPESDIDVVAEQTKQIEELQAELSEAKAIAEQSVQDVKILTCEAIIAKQSEGMTSVEAEKFYTLAENVEFDTEEEFAGKLSTLKESFFKKSSKSVNIHTQDENKVEMSEGKVHPDVEAVLHVLRNPDANKLIRSSN